jgi:5-formyltetrahydrofolate cyclo-ligase
MSHGSRGPHPFLRFREPARAPMTDAKSELRRHSLARRDLVSHEEAKAAAARIADSGAALVADIAAGAGLAAPVVSVYWPIRSEMNTRPLIEVLSNKGFCVVLPVMHAVRQPLTFRVFAPGDDLAKGPFGLSEPTADKASLDPDIVLAPLAAFDRNGFRLGYGGGIYDATLTALRPKKRVVVVGLAYALQEAESVPTEPHDQKLDYVLTEREAIRCA